MLDLVRTRQSVDPEVAGCAQLLAAIIADAITCASSAPNDFEIEGRINANYPSNDAARSIWFLFDDASLFPLYAQLIGLDHNTVRETLLNPNLNYKDKSGFGAKEARNVRIRYGWYKQLQSINPGYAKAMLEVPQRDEEHKSKKKKKGASKKSDAPNSIWAYSKRIDDEQQRNQ